MRRGKEIYRLVDGEAVSTFQKKFGNWLGLTVVILLNLQRTREEELKSRKRS